MKILGVEIFSGTRVSIAGENPFPWNVRLEYKGLKVVRGQKQTEVIFANGKSVTVTGTEPTVIQL